MLTYILLYISLLYKLYEFIIDPYKVL